MATSKPSNVSPKATAAPKTRTPKTPEEKLKAAEEKVAAAAKEVAAARLAIFAANIESDLASLKLPAVFDKLVADGKVDKITVLAAIGKIVGLNVEITKAKSKVKPLTPEQKAKAKAARIAKKAAAEKAAKK